MQIIDFTIVIFSLEIRCRLFLKCLGGTFS
jgi:hypothetical protein